MKIDEIKVIGVLGSGTMGRGIALSFAIAGYKVKLYDITDEVLGIAGEAIMKDVKKAVEKNKIAPEERERVLDRLDFTKNFPDLARCDFIVEAAPESIELKKEIFTKLDSTCAPNIVLSTNTSSLSVTTISTFVKNNPERVLGMHFFNPANIMKLVEIVKGDLTSQKYLDVTYELTKRIKKVPVIAKDTPAFIVNRIARPFYGEALKILSEGTADVETVDKVMKLCGGFAMGPFELMDLIGIDINFSVTRSVYEAFFNDPKYRPSFIQKKMVDANMLGRKTKKGFYSYEK